MRIASAVRGALALSVIVSTATAWAACPVGGCEVTGGGSTSTDCIVEYTGTTPNDPPLAPKRVRCTDGDPVCDSDGLANGSCRFRLAACLNNTDARFPSCPATPGAITTFSIANKPIGHPKRDAQFVALESAVNALLPTSSQECTDAVSLTVPLSVKGGVFKKGRKRLRSLANTAASTFDRDNFTMICEPSTAFPGPGTMLARATVITQPSQLIEGQLSRGQIGDYLIYNDKIQLVIQKPGRVMFGIGPYGGNIIDADLNRTDGERDAFEEWSPGINIENTANYTSVIVLNDGTNGFPAVIRATGPDDLLDYVNPSSVVAGFGFTFPPSADDTDLPVTIQTDYTLAAGASYVQVDTTVMNTSASPLSIFFNDFLNGSGQVELFQPGYGFGEPLVTEPCNISSFQACNSGTCDLCGLVAYAGEDEAAGVSYGYINPTVQVIAGVPNGTTTFSTSGVTVPISNRRAVFVLIGAQGPNFTIPASGSTTFTRYFAVGDGSVASLETIRNQVIALSNTGTLVGSVTSGGQPVANADVAVIRPKTCEGGSGTCTSPPKGPNCLCNVSGDCQSANCNDRGAGTSLNVFDHFRTDAGGSYSGTLPAGPWTVRVNKDGRLFGSPDPAAVTVIANSNVAQSFTLPAPGQLQVTVTDEGNNPIPAKIQLVGFDPSPDPLVTQTVAGLINNTTGVFGEQIEDGFVYGIAGAWFADRTGSIGTVEADPGTYQLVVSHGPRYSASFQTVTITAGATTSATAQIARVIDTSGYISADFHVHAVNSPDSEVTNQERVATMLAEGMDFFTPSDHDYRSDFAPVIAQMGVSDLISTVTSAEITTFDYGHFNSWPVPRNPAAVNGGGIDWGRAGIAPGMDFPSSGSYGLTPAEIFTAAHAEPGANLIQINHIASFFGRDGLDIDTAEAGTGPPQSHTPGAARRLDPSITNYFDTGFDALEVWIGTDGRSGDLNTFVGLNLGDWLNMLNQGILRSGVADSDTHQRRTTQINARNYIASAVTNPGLLVPEAFNLAGGIVSGHSIGTNAPFVTVATSAASTGETGGLGLGQPTLIHTTDGGATVTLNIKSPLWAEFDRVEFYVNSSQQAYDHDSNPATRKRYRAIATYTQNAGTDFTVNTINDFPLITGAEHLEATVTLNLTGLTDDVWVVALVRGTDGISRPLFPVTPNSIKKSTNTTLIQLTDGNLGEDGVVALAFTNPVYIDVDGDPWTAPGVQLVP